ncbi:MAG: RAMP superfamily CRISPR-associated protein [Oscillospiraceae bacterium]|nr:RAMP superfamily CRISPR-associated protein [Oscillospiraceae bacterium]
MTPIKRKVIIKLLTPVHIGGEPGEDVNISYILRDADGKAYYPGTAFKGKVRHYARQLQKDECKLTDNADNCECTVCKLFGGEGNFRGSLIFSNFRAVGAQSTDLRVGNSIDRFRRVAEDGALFTTESAAICELVGYVTGDADDCGLKLLENSIKLISQIGGNSSRGLGWIDGEIIVEDDLGKSDESADVQQNSDSDSDSALVTHVRVTIAPKSPMLIGAHTTQSNFRDTQFIIPGSVVRAALAKSICENDETATPKDKDGRIRWVAPIDGETHFPILREEFSNLKFSVLHSQLQSEPHPITMRKCKFHKNHKRVDVLSTLLSEAWKNGSVQELCAENGCKGRLEKVSAYEDVEDNMPTITSTHSEIDKWRGASRDERLYTVKAIAPDTAENPVVFCGAISGNMDMKELAHLQKFPLYVGAMLTSGFGECEVKFEAISDTTINDVSVQKSELRDRIDKFNALIGDSNETFVPITLMSDAIVDLEEPSDGDYTKAYESIVKPFKLERVITKARIWRGFDTSQSHNFEKSIKFLLQAGSVFVVRVYALDDEVLEALLEFERNGLKQAQEPHNGYGAVRIAHRNHIDKALTLERGQSQ